MSDAAVETVQSVRTTRKNGHTTIEIEVTGDGAWDRAKDLLKPEAERLGVDPDDITAFEATIEAEADGGDGGSGGTQSGGKSTGRLSESDRKLGDITPGTGAHEVLSRVSEAGRATQLDFKDDMVSASPSSVSAMLSSLWTKKLIDGERHSTPYEYWVSDHGRAYLDEHGLYLPDAEGGDD